MSKIHLIYETDALSVLPALEEVLGEIKRSNTISDFERIQDFSNLTSQIGPSDLVIILLSKGLEDKLDHYLSVLENLRHRKVNLQVIGLKVDETTGSFPYFVLPTDLLPIRDRHSPSLWNAIKEELKRKLPGSRRPRPYIIAGLAILVLLGLFYLLLPHLQVKEEEEVAREEIMPPIEDDEAIVDPGIPETELENEDCLRVFLEELSISEGANGFTIINRNSQMTVFRTREAAEQAISLLRQLEIDQICYVGRPGPSLTYLLSNGRIPSQSILDEDCISFTSPDNLVAREVSGGRYQISDGRSLLFMTDSKEEGERVIEVIQHYGGRQICYVERPNPGLTYLKQ